MVAGLAAALALALLRGPAVRAEDAAGGVQAGVLHLSRPVDADVLVLRTGERHEGRVAGDTFALRLPEGELILPLEVIAGLDFSDAVGGQVSVITERPDRLTGLPSSPAVGFVPRGGTEAVTWAAGDVLKVVFGRRPTADARSSAPARVEFRNGDFVFATPRGLGFVAAGGGREFAWGDGSLREVRFTRAGQPEATLLLAEGTSVSGRPSAGLLELWLDVGPVVRVHPGRVERILRAEGVLSAVLARIGSLGARASPSGADVPPDPAVVPVEGMIWIVPGRFTMGSPPEERERDLDEGPLTEVVIERGFWIGRCEVTQAAFEAVMGLNPSRYTGDGSLPVERVTWLEADEYCLRLTERERAAGRLPGDFAYRLPTEAEWEYACRAGTTTRFSHGEDLAASMLPDHAWFGDNGDSASHPVGTRRPNPWGLHDLHGNVLEWCLDAWRGSLPGGTVTNRVVLPEGTLRVARGGSWLYPARSCRSANRDSYGILNRCSDLGFRIVLARADAGR